MDHRGQRNVRSQPVREGRGNTSGEDVRRGRWLASRDLGDIADLDLLRLFYAHGGPAYSLGALAVEWLEGRAAAEGNEALLEPHEVGWPDSFTDTGRYLRYYRSLGSAEDWEATFEEAFGISPDDFYEAFEGYREALYPS